MRRLQELRPYALVTTGRTGSDFLQGLLDSHPEVMTFNGSLRFFGGYWNTARCTQVVPLVAKDLVDEFIGLYIHRLQSRYDLLERKDQLGPEHDQSLNIDTQEFRTHVLGLLRGVDISSRNMLLAIYGAYSLCLGQALDVKRIVFHHAHHLDELDLFAREFPGSGVVVTTRDPRATFVSGIEHWRAFDPNTDNERHLYGYIKRILEDSMPVARRGLRYIAVRLEDLPKERTMRALSDWLGITYDKAMSECTWGGLGWHGDRLSTRRYESAGWDKTRDDNRWRARLGTLDRYVLNYVMHDRLTAYGYSVSKKRVWDIVVVPLVIMLPMSYERRFCGASYLAAKLRSRNRHDIYHIAINPVFYMKRVGLFLRYYLKSFRGTGFDGHYLQAEEA